MTEKKSQKWTLKALAEELDVSIATMSNAFKRPDQLSPKLRKYILEECSKLGYTGPSATASSLRTGRTGIVGILLSNNLAYSFSDEVAHQLLEGMANVFEEANKGMLILSSRANNEQTYGLESFVDGFIIYGSPLKEIRDRLLIQDKPVVAVDFTMEGHASINIDNYQSAKKCADHALANEDGDVAILGIGLFRSDYVCRLNPDVELKPKSITVQRLNGFLDAAKAKGVTVPPERIWNIPVSTQKQAYQAAKEALSSMPRPKLLLCMSDRIALSALQAARHLGLKVPEDVRITGFDDIPEASTQSPSLTTVHQQSNEKGEIAAKILLGERESENILLETELVVRESCP